MKKIEIRVACPSDAEALLAVYAPYVRETAITFEYEVPTVEEFRGRIEQTLEKYPYLAAVVEGEVVGYAYASTFRKRAAYGWDVENSIYVRQDMRSEGVGKRLYEALERALTLQNIIHMRVCVTTPEEEDGNLTFNSLQFHVRMGYTPVGTIHNCGYKFGTWYHITWLEKDLTEPTQSPKPVKRFSEIQREWEAAENACQD